METLSHPKKAGVGFATRAKKFDWTIPAVIVCLCFLPSLIGGFFWFDAGLAHERDENYYRHIVDDLKGLDYGHSIEDFSCIGQVHCRRLGTVPFSIRGKILVWDMTDNSFSKVSKLLSQKHPDLMPPTSANLLHSIDRRAEVTVFIVMQGLAERQVGTYQQTRIPAVRYEKEVVVAYWPDRKTVGSFIVRDEPPDSIGCTNCEAVKDPWRAVRAPDFTPVIAEWIAKISSN